MIFNAFQPQPDGIPLIEMAPLALANLDFTENWGPSPNGPGWLVDGEVLTSATWVIDPGITKVAEDITNTMAIVKLTGGAVGHTYTCQCTITTNMTRTDTRSFRVRCIPR